MKELQIIDEQIAYLAILSQNRALSLEDVKVLESLVRSKVLLTTKAIPINTEENPFGELGGEDLKKILQESLKGRVGTEG